MEQVVEKYKQLVVQIATAEGTGTGFQLPDYGLIVTNLHVLDNSQEIVVKNEADERYLAKVLFIDERNDLAYLEMKAVPLSFEGQLAATDTIIPQGATVYALGHPYGMEYTTTKGVVSNNDYKHDKIRYIQHDATLNPGNSGGPLLSEAGEIVGVNTFILSQGQRMGFALPIDKLKDSLQVVAAHRDKLSAKCISCENIVFEAEVKKSICPHCGSKLRLPSDLSKYEPIGVPRVIEEVLAYLGEVVPLTRRGPLSWELVRGSATVQISFHKETGLISGDAKIAKLPKKGLVDIYAYLLHQNYLLNGLTLSVQREDILLTLLIYDRYLNAETGARLIRQLLEKADEYDNILVETFGAQWQTN